MIIYQLISHKTIHSLYYEVFSLILHPICKPSSLFYKLLSSNLKEIYNPYAVIILFFPIHKELRQLFGLNLYISCIKIS